MSSCEYERLRLKAHLVEKLKQESLLHPLQPRAKTYGGQYGEVQDKMEPDCPDEVCWRCRLNIDSHCTAFLHVTEADQDYRRDSEPLCMGLRASHRIWVQGREAL